MSLCKCTHCSHICKQIKWFVCIEQFHQLWTQSVIKAHVVRLICRNECEKVYGVRTAHSSKFKIIGKTFQVYRLIPFCIISLDKVREEREKKNICVSIRNLAKSVDCVWSSRSRTHTHTHNVYQIEKKSLIAFGIFMRLSMILVLLFWCRVDWCCGLFWLWLCARLRWKHLLFTDFLNGQIARVYQRGID